MMVRALPESRHFRIEKLAGGVYAAVHRDGGWAISNAGIIDLGDKTLIFDSLMTPAAASDLKDAAEAVTGRRTTLLINSHYHNDHVWGNQIFSDTTIISTSQTRQLILSDGREEVNWFSQNGAEQLNDLQHRYGLEFDEAKKREMLTWIEYFQGIVATTPILQLVLPALTFEERLVIHGSTRSIELLTFGGGHTGSDVMLFIPEEKIIFMADLLFVESHPFLADGDPVNLLRILDKALALNPQLLVPGHGPVGTPTDAGLVKRYVNDMEAMTAEMIRQGKTVDDISEDLIPPDYHSWGLRQFFLPNLRFFIGRQGSGEETG